ncbi:MAG: ATP synthase subunit I [Pleurocapsa minor HA4230-MV1]|nr:ATP synthase subunit I [Pleurocapsa minor HA4230-MV1]
MSQATSWQQTLNICRLLIKDKQFQRLSGQALCLMVFALLWWMNWKLFLSTSMGIGAMSACYLAQNSHWQSYCRQWRNFFVGSNRQLSLAVGTGASAAFCTYLAASIWADADNQWLATGNILQGFVSLTTLICLLWSLRGKKASSLEAKLDQLLIDLSDRDRLKRLVAIRQLTRLLINNRLSAEHYEQSIEYYRLMLSEPQPAVIKDALLESLDLLGAAKILEPRSVIKIPLQFKHSPKPVLDNRS